MIRSAEFIGDGLREKNEGAFHSEDSLAPSTMC